MNPHDELDRALFALPLETPPPGLREGILRATIYAQPAAQPALLSLWETVGLGVVLAVASWLALALSTNKVLAWQIGHVFGAFGQALADPGTLARLAAGAFIALSLSVFNLGLPGPAVRAERS